MTAGEPRDDVAPQVPVLGPPVQHQYRLARPRLRDVQAGSARGDHAVLDARDAGQVLQPHADLTARILSESRREGAGRR